MYLIRLDGKLSVLLCLSGKILDVLVVFRIFDTWIHYQAPSEWEFLSLNDPFFACRRLTLAQQEVLVQEEQLPVM